METSSRNKRTGISKLEGEYMKGEQITEEVKRYLKDENYRRAIMYGE